MTRYIFITGGVVSSLGKGIASASLGALLQARGYKVRLRKLDPYLNVDPGTMSPYQHGEVFVTEDGIETDLDIGHYERFTGVNAREGDSTTTGKIYMELLSKERRGDYLGKTVQVIPHVTDLIKNFITSNTDDVDFIICEIGGTVGDIEAQPFCEAIRQLGDTLGRQRVIYVHLTLLPFIAAANEIKTKPTQHSVKELRSIGIQPNILLTRCEHKVSLADREKIALFCSVPVERVIPALDQASIYSIPSVYHKSGLDTQVLKFFELDYESSPDLKKWDDISRRISHPAKEVKISIVCKYDTLKDAYISLAEAVKHAGIALNAKVEVSWVSATAIEKDGPEAFFKDSSAILVPGGFGARGTEGKIAAIKYARENNIPFLGICLGMQLAIVEFARNVLGIKDANSTEFSKKCTNVIGLMTEWMKGEDLEKRKEAGDLGGTMRLGAFDCAIAEKSLAHKIYGSDLISERHRHRYEFNLSHKGNFEKAGLKFSGMSPDGQLTEIIEIPNHSWFVGVQFHPELKSRAFKPHQLFTSFIKTAITRI